jgi:adenylate cyclase
LRRVREFLLDHGASDEEIARAQAEDLLDLLVADRLVVPSAVRYTEAEVSQRTGMPVELSRRFWRALGFPDPTPEDALFTDLDIEAIIILEAVVELGFADVESALQLARVVGSSMARIADAEVSPAILGVFAPPGSGDSVEAADRFARLADQTLPAMGRLLEFVWRRHFQAAIRRAMLLRSRGESATLPELCIGFADMVGFTMLSQQLSEDELAALISRFEDVAHDVVTSLGGRVVKMIGDEVMFVAESPTAAGHIALGLAETYADDELLSDVRVALAVGPVLAQDGDYYGPVVNLAKRVADIAAPGSVLVTDEFHSALVEALVLVDEGRRHAGVEFQADEVNESAQDANPVSDSDETLSVEGFAFRPLRPRLIRDVGRVTLWSLYRPGAEPLRLDRRVGSRWERLAEVLRELDDLRERGEKLISGGLRAAAEDRSGLWGAEGGDAERSEREGSVEGGDRPSPQVD